MRANSRQRWFTPRTPGREWARMSDWPTALEVLPGLVRDVARRLAAAAVANRESSP